MYLHVRTPTLDVAYLEWNPKGARVAFLLHGWPDSPETWRDVAPALAGNGFRVIAPALRGFGATRFNDPRAVRSGELAALGRDLLELVDTFGVEKPALVGHDWGARAVANACGLRPGVASHLVMLAVGYGTNDPSQKLSYAMTHNYWYHWFMATGRGAQAVESDRKGFTRYMWDAWGPNEWVTDADFEEAARAFDNPDWAAVTLHSYRMRWNHAEPDPKYAADTQALTPAPVLSVPTMVIHGGDDRVNLAETSAGKERFFTGRYERIVFDGIGHFPQREDPRAVVRELIRFLG